MSDSIITGDGPSLLITHPDQTCTTFCLNEIEQLTIGYSSNAMLRLTGDQTISRIQLELVREGNYYFVINRSMNRQTFLNKKPMAINEKIARPLHNDDEITFGKYRLLFPRR